MCIRDRDNNISVPSDAITITHDNIAPVITAFDADNAVLGANATTSITIVFDESVYGFEGEEVNKAGAGAIGSFSGIDDDSSYSIVYTAPASGTGTVTLSVAGSVAIDLAGNQNVITNEVVVAFDADNPIPPSLALDNDTGPENTDGVTASSTVNVTDLEAGASWEYQSRIGGEGGEGAAWGSEWTAGEGTTFTVATNTTREYRARQTDTSNNISDPSNGITITHDSLQPTITTFSIGNTTLGADATTSISIVFNENMYGFTDSDVVMTGDGATSTFSGADGDSLYSLVYTSPNSGTGTVLSLIHI